MKQRLTHTQILWWWWYFFPIFPSIYLNALVWVDLLHVSHSPSAAYANGVYYSHEFQIDSKGMTTVTTTHTIEWMNELGKPKKWRTKTFKGRGHMNRLIWLSWHGKAYYMFSIKMENTRHMNHWEISAIDSWQRIPGIRLSIEITFYALPVPRLTITNWNRLKPFRCFFFCIMKSRANGIDREFFFDLLNFWLEFTQDANRQLNTIVGY